MTAIIPARSCSKGKQGKNKGFRNTVTGGYAVMLSIRLAKKDDFDFFYKLKSEDFNVFWTGGESKPDMENLKEFFFDAVDKAHHSGTRKIYMIENELHEKIGHLYIIPSGENFELACAVLHEFGGRGYAKKAIKLGLEEGERLGFKRMVSSIREDNIASMKAYTACGIKVLEDYKEKFIPGLGKKVKMYVIVYDYDHT